MEQTEEEAVVEQEGGGGKGAVILAKLKRFALPIAAGLVLILLAGGGFAYWSAKKHRAEVEQQRAAKLAEEAAKEAVEAAKARELSTELHKQHQAVLEAPTSAPAPQEEAVAVKAEESGKADQPHPEEKKAEKPELAKKEVPAGTPATVVAATGTPPANAKKAVPGNTCTVRGGTEAGDSLARCLQEYNRLDRR